jgi:hypothetical protein
MGSFQVIRRTSLDVYKAKPPENLGSPATNFCSSTYQLKLIAQCELHHAGTRVQPCVVAHLRAVSVNCI